MIKRIFIPGTDIVDAERQASAGARDGVKGKRNDLDARAPLHALVRCVLATLDALTASASLPLLRRSQVHMT